MSKKLATAIYILSIIGLADASYLTYEHFSEGDIVCLILEGCDAVVNSKYSVIYGVPLAMLGAFYYAANLIVSHKFIQHINKTFLKLYLAMTTFGFLFSLYLTYLQLVVINSICSFCLISATISSLIFLISIFLYRSQASSPSKDELSI